MTFQQIFLTCWIISGAAFVIFSINKTGSCGPMTALLLTMIGPGCWINIDLIGIFKKQFRKTPDIVTNITFIISMIIVIILLSSIFPEIWSSTS